MSFFEELQRRRVFRVAGVYIVACFAMLQGADLIIPALRLPDVVLSVLVVVALLGFPVAVALAWAFDVTPEGVRRSEAAEPALRRRRPHPLAVTGVVAVTALLGFGGYAQFLGTPAAEVAGEEIDRSIAVLPFVNMSGDPENEYFSDGLSEELLNVLAQVPGLRVAARTSSFSFKGRNVPVAEIGTALSVAHVLEGSVRRSGGKVRITAQLINARTGYHLWSDTYDRELSDVFAIQDEISAAIGRELRLRLGDGGTAPARAAVDPEIHDLYLRGRFFFNKGSKEGLEKALDYYRQALERAPDYAPAYAGMAEVYGFLADAYLPPEESYPKTIEYARKAIELDPELPDAHASLGLALSSYEWDHEGARQAFRRALELNPNHAFAHFFSSIVHIAAGDVAAGIEAARTATRLDPLSAIFSHFLTWFYTYDGRAEEALAQHARTVEIDPNFIYIDAFVGEAYRQLGRYDEAIAAFQAGEKLLGRSSVGLGVTYAVMGRRAEAERIARELEAGIERGQYVPPEFVARIYAALGDTESTLRLLEKGIELRSAGAPMMAVLPEFRPLYGEPRFQEVIRRTGIEVRP